MHVLLMIVSVFIMIYFSEAKVSERFNRINVTYNDDIIIHKSMNCSHVSDCSYRGVCSLDRTSCVCDEGFVTHNSTSSKQCNYKQKLQFYAVFYSMFLGMFGAGHFYIGKTTNAYIQLIFGGIGWIIILNPLLYFCITSCVNGRDNNIIRILKIASTLTIVWCCFLDIVHFAQNDHKDSNGVSLLAM